MTILVLSEGDTARQDTLVETQNRWIPCHYVIIMRSDLRHSFHQQLFPWSYNQTWVKSDVGALTFWLESVRWYHGIQRGKSAEIGEPSYPSLVGSQRQVWPAIGLQPLKHNVWLRIDRCLLVFRIPRALPIFWNKANAKFLLGPSAAAKSASSVLNQSVGFNPVVEGLHGLTIPFWWYSNSSPLPCSLLCPIWTC